MSFFVSDAVADVGTSSHGNPYSWVIILVVFVFLFYFMIIRPQQKRTKAHKELMNSLSKGDEVLTTGGLVGRVVNVMETGYVSIALNENSEVVIKRDFITAVLPKGTIKAL